ncbi:hypothetical protein DOE63_21465 [Salmonella enterica subsp. diarizonae serovar 59:z10:-]|nr:hypothetical protein DOE63_21465 [Salmonella enterica subsp. diarizonae serovar 59:z10:-]
MTLLNGREPAALLAVCGVPPHHGPIILLYRGKSALKGAECNLLWQYKIRPCLHQGPSLFQ